MVLATSAPATAGSASLCSPISVSAAGQWTYDSNGWGTGRQRTITVTNIAAETLPAGYFNIEVKDARVFWSDGEPEVTTTVTLAYDETLLGLTGSPNPFTSTVEAPNSYGFATALWTLTPLGPLAPGESVTVIEVNPRTESLDFLATVSVQGQVCSMYPEGGGE